jgi:hypothetical protein
MASIVDCAMHWRVPASSDELLAECDAVITHEFGNQIIPSQSTIAIVQHAVELCRKYNKPLITQFPGDVVAQELGFVPYAVIRTHKLVAGKYLDTEEVNRQAAMICSQNNWKRIIVCTHPHHVWRAGCNMQKFNLEPLYAPNAHIQYDKTCSRKSVRSPWYFVPREICARALYIQKGYL